MSLCAKGVYAPAHEAARGLSRCFYEKGTHHAKKLLQLVMMDPMPRPGDVDTARIAEGPGPSILLGVCAPALRTTQEERRTGNALPETPGFIDVELVGRL